MHWDEDIKEISLCRPIALVSNDCDVPRLLSVEGLVQFAPDLYDENRSAYN